MSMKQIESNFLLVRSSQNVALLSLSKIEIRWAFLGMTFLSMSKIETAWVFFAVLDNEER
jgi:hypothetical protein